MKLKKLLIPSVLIFLGFAFSWGTFLYAFPGDSLSTLWYISLFKTNQISLFDTFYPLTNYPWGFAIFSFNYQPIFVLILFLFSKLPVNIFQAYQLLVFSIILLNFFSVYFVSSKLLDKGPARFIPALMVITSNYFQWRLTQHLDLSMIFWLPLYFYALFLILVKPSVGRGLLAGFVLALALMTSFQYGFFLVVLTPLVALVFIFLFRRQDIRKFFLPATALVTSGIFFSLPVIFNLAGYFLNRGQKFFGLALSRNSLDDLIAYGARPWDYLLPSVAHPVFGDIVSLIYKAIREKFSYQFWSPYLSERSNYLTIVGLGLTFFGLIYLYRQKQRAEKQKLETAGFFLILTVVAFVLSLPATITFQEWHFHLPSYFLFQIFPFFRVYARTGLFVILGVSFLAGFGLENLTKILVGKGRRLGFLTLLVFPILFFENLTWPPLPILNISKVPDYYQWLAKTPPDRAIIEYPRDNSRNDLGGGCPDWLSKEIVRDYSAGYTSLYQAFHRHPVLGYSSLTKEEKIKLSDLSSQTAYEVLSYYQVKYVVVVVQDPLINMANWPLAYENPLDECWSRRVMKKPEKVYEKFKPVVEFTDGIIYEVQ